MGPKMLEISVQGDWTITNTMVNALCEFFSVTFKFNSSLTFFIVANKHCVRTEFKIVFF